MIGVICTKQIAAQNGKYVYGKKQQNHDVKHAFHSLIMEEVGLVTYETRER
jgi:hypothetical protein